MPNKHDKNVENVREVMGTLPYQNTDPYTNFHIGVEGIEIEMIDHTVNPYKTIFEAVTATWGSEEYTQKWDEITPVRRFDVVKTALAGQTLPQALEPVQFMFLVRGASRSAFDQHARVRVGAGIFSQGVRDNSRADAGFRVPSEFADDPELLNEIIDHVKAAKDLYSKILEKGNGSYQSARSVLPMGSTHNYKFYTNLLALKGYMANRLKACEQEDTCFTAIAIRHAVEQAFPLLASHMRPGCDYARKCQYHSTYSMSEYFGCLFAGCGRWPDDENAYATFNRSCSSHAKMADQGGILLPHPGNWKEYQSFDDLKMSDRKLFRE